MNGGWVSTPKGYMKARNPKPKTSELSKIRKRFPIAAHCKRSVHQKSFSLGQGAYGCTTDHEFLAFVLNRNANSQLERSLKQTAREQVLYQRFYRRDIEKAHERSERLGLLHNETGESGDTSTLPGLLTRRASAPSLVRKDSFAVDGTRDIDRCKSTGSTTKEISRSNSEAYILQDYSCHRRASTAVPKTPKQIHRKMCPNILQDKWRESLEDLAISVVEEMNSPVASSYILSTFGRISQTTSHKEKNSPHGAATVTKKVRLSKQNDSFSLAKIDQALDTKVKGFLNQQKTFNKDHSLPKDILAKTEQSRNNAQVILAEKYKMSTIAREVRKKLGLDKPGRKLWEIH